MQWEKKKKEPLSFFAKQKQKQTLPQRKSKSFNAQNKIDMKKKIF